MHHALGLTLTREKQTDDALNELRAAAELEPDRSRYAYVYAVALHSSGHIDDAIKILKENLGRHPDDRNTLLALISFNRDAGAIDAALEYAEQLARVAPDTRELAQLIDDLRARARH